MLSLPVIDLAVWDVVMRIPACRLCNLAICGGNPNGAVYFLLQAEGND